MYNTNLNVDKGNFMHITINGPNNSEYVFPSNDIYLEKTANNPTEAYNMGPYNYYVISGSGHKIHKLISSEEYERVKKILQCLNGDILKSLIGQVEDIKVREGLSKVTSALFRLDVGDDDAYTNKWG